MKGAIIGDIIGSVYEHNPVKREDFELFSEASRITDDSILTAATAWALLGQRDYASSYIHWGRKYPQAGYGGLFQDWLASSNPQPYNSWGNGAAMRVSPIAWAFGKLEEVEREAARSAEVTHNHPEGIKGAQSVAAAIFLARNHRSKEEIKTYIENKYQYNLSLDYGRLRTNYYFEVSAQGSVPQAIVAFLNSKSYEDAIRKAVALGGDSDTQACIAGAIAQAFYGKIPIEVLIHAHNLIPREIMDVIVQFNKAFKVEIKSTILSSSL
jgi:ADP-ribosyl-[dinitrogen reductase] hydrolase